MHKPRVTDLAAAVGISKTYASDILADKQPPPLNLAALIYRETGWRHPTVSEMSDETLAEIADKQPWSPPKARAA